MPLNIGENVVENEIIIAIIAEKKTLTCHSTTKVLWQSLSLKEGIS